jgi:hypothetical protein
MMFERRTAQHEERAMATTPAVKERRNLHYDSLQQLLSDAETIAAGDYDTVGNWSYGQILNHLAKAMAFSLDGFPGLAPWPVRVGATLFLKQRFLTQTLRPGFKLPKRAAALLPQEFPTPEALQGFRAVIARFDNEVPRAAHPLFGRLTPEEWHQLHLRHAELHMSYVRPVGN